MISLTLSNTYTTGAVPPPPKHQPLTPKGRKDEGERGGRDEEGGRGGTCIPTLLLQDPNEGTLAAYEFNRNDLDIREELGQGEYGR